MPEFSWSTAINIFAPVFLGALLGYLGGLRIERRARQKELERRRPQVLQALADAIEHNRELVRQSLDTFREDTEMPRTAEGDPVILRVVYFPLDPRAVDVLIPDVRETTGDLDLVRRVSNVRFHLESQDRKLATQYEIAFRSEAAISDTAEGAAARILRGKIVGSAIVGAGKLLVAADDLLEDLAGRLGESWEPTEWQLKAREGKLPDTVDDLHELDSSEDE